jgi:hypothetical protein
MCNSSVGNKCVEVKICIVQHGGGKPKMIDEVGVRVA